MVSKQNGIILSYLNFVPYDKQMFIYYFDSFYEYLDEGSKPGNYKSEWNLAI